jgi:hypothetical protein
MIIQPGKFIIIYHERIWRVNPGLQVRGYTIVCCAVMLGLTYRFHFIRFIHATPA